VDRQSKTSRDYLKMPYARVLTPDAETGTYTAEILEFPGCIAQGDTPEEAYEHLESAAAGWIEAALDMGQEIPEPSDPYSYSGRIALRLPRSLHRRAAQMAERDGTSLNQFLVSAIAERVGAGSAYGQMAQWLEEHAGQIAAGSARPAVNIVFNTASPHWSWPKPGSDVFMRAAKHAVSGGSGVVEMKGRSLQTLETGRLG
jgi:predicted RNase H-like HicB family nuclease